MDMDSYRINARAWEAVLARMHELRDQGESMAAISRLMKVGRATVKQWLDYGRGGDRISFRHMIHYLDRLQIPLDEVFGVEIDLPPSPEPRLPESLDKAMAEALNSVMNALGKSRQTVMRNNKVAAMDPIHVNALLDGQEQFAVTDLCNICEGIGIKPGEILTRAVELASSHEKEGDATRRSA